MLQVLIADDHLAVRIGMMVLAKEVLGSCSIDMAAEGIELFRLLNAVKYNILITDLNMPDLDSTSFIKEIVAIQPAIKILVVSVNPSNTFAKYCIQAGAFGYIQKGTDDSEIKNAIQNLSIGKKYITGNQVNTFLDNQQHSNPFDTLSARELEVMFLLLKGNGLLEVSNILDIAISTVSTYKRRIFEKLNVTNTMDLKFLSEQQYPSNKK
ncbi:MULTISPECIES: response regulator [Chitinophagaceae]